MVRINSIAQSTRVAVVGIMSQEDEAEAEVESSDDDDLVDFEEKDWDGEEEVDEVDMAIATVYEDTITALGEFLDTSTVQDTIMS